MCEYAVDIVASSATARVGVRRPFSAVAAAPDGLRQGRISTGNASPARVRTHPHGAAPLDTLLAAQPAHAADLRDDVLGPGPHDGLP
jgi:hypothetical protein